jgi:hypothetical protein
VAEWAISRNAQGTSETQQQGPASISDRAFFLPVNLCNRTLFAMTNVETTVDGTGGLDCSNLPSFILSQAF